MSISSIDLLRHGQVSTQGLFCAASSEPLSELGWQQLSTVTSHYKPERVISSPSRRCLSFAQHFSQQRAIPLQIEVGIQEMNFGDWIGQSSATIWEKDKEQLQLLWSKPLQFTAPHGESMLDFIKRVKATWQSLITTFAGQHLLLITHGGVIRVLLAQALGIDYAHTLKFELAYGQAVRLRIYPDGSTSVYALGLERLAC